MATKQTIDIGSASAAHDEMVAANVAQRERLAGTRKDDWAALAPNFQADPLRKLDSLLEKIASYVKPGDVVIDVGGGAGRLSLPLALRCNQVVIVDPSDGMRHVFDKTVKDAGISNARYEKLDWLDASEIEGDVALVAHVTYFVRQISPFIEKLNAATRKRVVVCVRSIPPPNQVAPFFSLAHDEPLAEVPGHEQLLAVLEEMGIRPERIDVGPATASATAQIQEKREDAINGEIQAAQRMGWLGKVRPETLTALINEHFDDLFVRSDKGFVRRNIVDARDLLITWETR